VIETKAPTTAVRLIRSLDLAFISIILAPWLIWHKTYEAASSPKHYVELLAARLSISTFVVSGGGLLS
jgi:hypothetical protein